MRRRILMIALFLGTVGGYAAGFHSLRHHRGEHCGGRWSQGHGD